MRDLKKLIIFAALLITGFSVYANDNDDLQLEPYAKSAKRIGKLDFYLTYQYSFKSSGNLKHLNVDVGEQFKKGDLLASVDTDELNSELNSLLAEKSFVNEEVKRLLALRKQNAVSASEYERNKSQSSQLKAAIIRVRQLIEATSIIAPYDGIVIARHLELGEFAAPGQTILEIAPINNNLVINVDVLGNEIRYLNYGDELLVSARDGSNSQLSKVKKLSSTPNQSTGLYSISLQIQPFKNMVIGSLFDVELSGENQLVFRVPAHLLKVDFNQTALIKTKSDSGKVSMQRFNIVDFTQDYVLVEPNGLTTLSIIK